VQVHEREQQVLQLSQQLGPQRRVLQSHWLQVPLQQGLLEQVWPLALVGQPV
jgi:hypothetical protein